MRPITVKELTDILFQTPDRITAGILEQRSPAEKLRDSLLTREDKHLAKSGQLKNLSKKLFLHFNAAARIAEEHPRSLKKAALELKALGFSNKQVEDIKHICFYFIVEGAQPPSGPLQGIFATDHPGAYIQACDKAFLGTALQPTVDEAKIRKESKNASEAFEKIHKKMTRPANTRNTVFISAEREEQAYAAFQQHLSEHLQWKKLGAEFLTPAKPHKRATALLV